MPQWECCEIHLSELPPKTNVLNDASINGWEQVVITVNNVGRMLSSGPSRGVRGGSQVRC